MSNYKSAWVIYAQCSVDSVKITFLQLRRTEAVSVLFSFLLE